MKKIIVVLFLAITFIACEGQTIRVFTVVNSSSSEIFIDSVPGFDTTYNFTVLPNSSTEIQNRNLLGGSSSPADRGFLSTVFIYNAIGDTITKEIWIDSNWTDQIEQVQKVPSTWHHDYTFEVSDSDF